MDTDLVLLTRKYNQLTLLIREELKSKLGIDDRAVPDLREGLSDDSPIFNLYMIESILVHTFGDGRKTKGIEKAPAGTMRIFHDQSKYEKRLKIAADVINTYSTEMNQAHIIDPIYPLAGALEMISERNIVDPDLAKRAEKALKLLKKGSKRFEKKWQEEIRETESRCSDL